MALSGLASATRNIIVIGASAGGLKPLRWLMGRLPADLKAAVFVCVHIPADRPSKLPELLSKAGPLGAHHPADGEEIREGCVYVAPPDNHLLVDRHRVRVLRGPQENRYRPAVDALFRSAAQAHGPRAIGVVLSGQLQDGTVGLQAIKRCGGVAVVQDPRDAEYDSMPKSAMRYVDIDHCATLEALPELLLRLVGESIAEAARDPQAPKDIEVESMIAEQKLNTAQFLEKVESIGARTTYACPLCNGSVWQIGKTDPLRFRCHVGHSFTAEYFWAEQSQNLENALWSAIRIMEEKVTFARQFAERMRANRLPEVAVRYEAHATKIDTELGVIRGIIVGGRGTTRNVFEDDLERDDGSSPPE
jgi:two-component system, chemotaxis family, protein-glutamate methylesterase/glutaminase